MICLKFSALAYFSAMSMSISSIPCWSPYFLYLIKIKFVRFTALSHAWLAYSQIVHMHLSCKFRFSPVKVTCSGWSLKCWASSVFECVSKFESVLCSLLSVRLELCPLLRSDAIELHRRVSSVGVEQLPICTEWPQQLIPCPPSMQYRYVCDVKIISGSSGITSDGTSWEAINELQPPLLQWNSAWLRPWLLPSIRQKRHLIFSSSFSMTVFLRRI